MKRKLPRKGHRPSQGQIIGEIRGLQKQVDGLGKGLGQTYAAMRTVDMVQDAFLMLFLGNWAKRILAWLLFGVSRKAIEKKYMEIRDKILKASEAESEDKAEKEEVPEVVVEK